MWLCCFIAPTNTNAPLITLPCRIATTNLYPVLGRPHKYLVARGSLTERDDLAFNPLDMGAQAGKQGRLGDHGARPWSSWRYLRKVLVDMEDLQQSMPRCVVVSTRYLVEWLAIGKPRRNCPSVMRRGTHFSSRTRPKTRFFPRRADSWSIPNTYRFGMSSLLCQTLRNETGRTERSNDRAMKKTPAGPTGRYRFLQAGWMTFKI
jgi:hypothetical protein